MKICFISPKAYPLFNTNIKATFGGAEVQLSLISNEMASDKENDISLMVADYGQNEVENIKDITLYKSLNFKDYIFIQVINFFKTFNKVNADVYIQRTLTPYSCFIALYSRITSKNFIYMVAHDNETDGTSIQSKGLFGRLSIYLLYSFANLIVVQNEYEESNLKGRFPNIQLFLLKKGIDIQKYNKEATKKYDAIWVGRAEEWKRPNLFLKLCSLNPERKFLMVCPPATSHGDFHVKIKEEAKTLENLVFVDFATNQDIFNNLSESKVFIFTSVNEGDWPMTVLEAAASKLPIVSFSLKYSKLIEEGGGIFAGGDFVKLNSELNELLEDPGRIISMGEKAHRYIQEFHSIEKNTKLFSKRIEKIVWKR